MRSPSWQSRVVHQLVRVRMRPHALSPIDPEWVRRNMGRPRAARALMARASGAAFEQRPAVGHWPGGERVWWPTSAARRTPASALAAPHADSPVILYLHGGGYIACSPETHRPLVSSLVRRMGGEAFVPRYRLAPEHPFPAALDDAAAAYHHLVGELGVHPTRLVLAGDSAGGGLALALAMRLRDAGAAQPTCVLMFCPWTDLAATGASLDENSDRCAMFAGETIRRAARFYVGGDDPARPQLSPLFGDFRALPPLLLHASQDEVLRDDSVRVAVRARAAGVTTSLELWAHVPHVWQFFAGVLPEARESLAKAVEFAHAAINEAKRRLPNDADPSRNDT